MRVLFVSNEQFLPLSGGGSIGNFKIAKKFVERGHEVTVATPLYLPKDELKKLEAEHKIRLRPFSPYYLHKNVPFRGPKYLLYSILFIPHMMRLLLRDRYDMVFVRNCLLGFSSLPFRPFVGAMYVVSMTDFLTGFLYNNPHYPKPLVNLLFGMERFVTRFFDIVFVITPQMRAVVSQGGCPTDRIHVSYDGVEGSIFSQLAIDSTKVQQLRDKYPKGRRIAIFHGTIDDHAQRKLAEIIPLVQERDKDLIFLLFGQGKKYEELKAKLRSDSVIFPGYIRHEDIPLYVAAADVGIIPYEHNFNADMIITLKLLEYLSMGLPVVSTDLRSIKELFGMYDFLALTSSSFEFADAIVSMSRRPKSQQAAKLIASQYTWDRVTSGIVKTLEDECSARGL